jgi:hypothetical protein
MKIRHQNRVKAFEIECDLRKMFPLRLT